jgi:catechol 2,3-dioxygenase-like lactoylglutathione lyase family enzyme
MKPTHAPELRFHHVSLSVADLDAQLDWYARSLGLTQVIERFELPEPRVRTVVLQAPNGVRIELIERAGSLRSEIYNDPLDTSRGQGYGHWALEVDDVNDVFARLVGSGGEPIWPPADAVQPGARFAYVKDPEGNLIELIQPPARAS